MNIETELRNASDALLAALEQLHELELQKRELQPGSERFVELARQIEALSDELLETSRSETVLAGRVADKVERGEGPDRPIVEMAPERDLGMVLSEWRDAERRLAGAKAGSKEASRAQEDAARLRDEYRSRHRAAARGQGRPAG